MASSACRRISAQAGSIDVGVVEGVPMGTYRLLTQNPVTGVGAKAYVTLSYNHQVRDVLLIEQFRGEVWGYVIDSYGVDRVAGATVVQNVNDVFTPSRSITTNPFEAGPQARPML